MTIKRAAGIVNKHIVINGIDGRTAPQHQPFRSKNLLRHGGYPHKSVFDPLQQIKLDASVVYSDGFMRRVQLRLLLYFRKGKGRSLYISVDNFCALAEQVVGNIFIRGERVAFREKNRKPELPKRF